ncbi:MAG TPA: YqaJ viral recombinase family protein [Fluviicoccus sp.]|nr:YqaJ viral recombinase family protein [Fluviicoccus sp.]
MNLTREVIEFSSEAEWLALRKNDITSTEAAGLFDSGSYVNSRTFYELFNIKSGLLEPKPFKDNDRTKWGNRLEAAIAYGIAEDLGLIVEPFKTYMRIVELRMGSSFDFKIVGLVDGFEGDQSARDMFKEHGPGILEVKNVDALQFRRNWLEDGENIEATAQIEMQVQHQLEVADMNWSLIAPLVGGNTPKIVIRLRDREAGQAIREKAAELWQRVAAGNPPPPDYTKDGDTIARVYVNNDGTEVDLSGNSRLIAVCAAYSAAGVAEKDAKARKDAAKAEILDIIKHHKTVHAGAFKIGAGTNKEVFKAYIRETGERWTISKSVIPGGQVEATTPAYRNLRVTGLKPAA